MFMHLEINIACKPLKSSPYIVLHTSTRGSYACLQDVCMQNIMTTHTCMVFLYVCVSTHSYVMYAYMQLRRTAHTCRVFLSSSAFVLMCTSLVMSFSILRVCLHQRATFAPASACTSSKRVNSCRRSFSAPSLQVLYSACTTHRTLIGIITSYSHWLIGTTHRTLIGITNQGRFHVFQRFLVIIWC
jgi:hypothetical protein